jgi:predicted ATP-grasp superfamily ATP-dependent carboligase
VWTPEEDSLLCAAQRTLGNKWSEISRMLPGRAENAVKNRFNSLITKRLSHGVQVTIVNQYASMVYIGTISCGATAVQPKQCVKNSLIAQRLAHGVQVSISISTQVVTWPYLVS